MSQKSLTLVRTIKDLRKAVAGWRDAGKSVALVPTMGALHRGHLSLVRLARKKADRTVVSLFVNPTQFAPTEDLSRYPRDETGDRQKLLDAGVDLLWAPGVADMYPDGFATRIEPAGPALGLEGSARPHHFGGVATVCLKLFTAAAPDFALFGEKDYQQLCVIRRMVRDFDLPPRIVAHPTVREKDGLALSSRNAYLSPAERAVAPLFQKSLATVADRVRNGEPAAKAVKDAERDLKRAGFTKVDYIEVRDADTLAPFDPSSNRPARVLGAVWLGKTRLIDNVAATFLS